MLSQPLQLIWLGVLALLCASCAAAGAISTTYRQFESARQVDSVIPHRVCLGNSLAVLDAVSNSAIGKKQNGSEMVAQLRRAYTESYRTFRTVERQALYYPDAILTCNRFKPHP